MASRFNIEIIVLAAGLSRRMGEANKLLMEQGGVPLVRRTVQHYRACSDRVTVVTGHDAAKVRAALEGLDVTCVRNPDYASGRQSSARFGLGRAMLDRDGVMIGLADQPLLEASDIVDLIAAFYRAKANKIMIPYYGDDRGNPILVPGHIARRMRASDQAPGCRKFIDANPQLVERVAVETNHFTADMDLPQEAASFGYRPMSMDDNRVGSHI